jgi:HlyD family secretion protein
MPMPRPLPTTLGSLIVTLEHWRAVCAGVAKWQARRIARSEPGEALRRFGDAFKRRAESIVRTARVETLQGWGKVARLPSALIGLGRGSDLEPALARRLVLGLALIGLLVLSCGVWAATTPIAGAVIASGIVVVESNIKKVQHPSGGIVAEIAVKNGDRVTAGDVVLRLDETQARANLGIIASQMVQLMGRKARLEAERDQAGAIRFPARFLDGGEEAAAIAEGEKRLFEFRRTSKRGQVAQLTERIGQFREEIKGLTAQRDAKSSEVELMVEELERLEYLRKKELMATNRILAAQRDLTRLKGEWGALTAQTARAHGQISETELQVLALDQTMQTEASKELREMEARMAELAERRIAAEDQLRRIVLRAPQTGIVHDLAVHTVGGVIGAGETVMTIVPSQEELGIEVRIATSDIDQVHVGQEASLRFPAFNQRITPEIKGWVTRVGADLSKEAQTNAVFYTARIRADEQERAKLKLIPGMPVDAFLATGERTAISYLVKPVTDQFARAFRER